MTPDKDIDDFITAAAALLKLTVPPESRASVRANLLRLAHNHAIVASAPPPAGAPAGSGDDV